MNKCLMGVLLISEVCIASPKKFESKVVWEVNQSLEQPESVYYDEASKNIFISNVSGEPLNKDKKGWITVLSSEGKVIAEKWFTELNAPKGIRVFKGILWVSDIDRVVAIDVKTAKQLKSIEIAGSKFLNDIAISNDGTVYVSDTSGNRIYRIKGETAEVFAEGADLEAPNRLLIKEPYMFVAGWGTEVGPDLTTKGPGSLYRIDLKSKKKSAMLAPLGHLDGLEASWKSLQGFVVSDWVAGKVYLTGKSNKPVATLLEGLEGSADIGVISEQKVILVPEMKSSKVKAYKFGE